MGFLGCLFSKDEDESITVIVVNEHNGETSTSIAENEEEFQEGVQALRDAGYDVEVTEGRPGLLQRLFNR